MPCPRGVRRICLPTVCRGSGPRSTAYEGHSFAPGEVLIQNVPTFHIPAHSRLRGLKLYFQVFMINAPAFPNDPIKMSNGLQITLGEQAEMYGQGSGMVLWAPMEPKLGKPFKPAFRFGQ